MVRYPLFEFERPRSASDVQVLRAVRDVMAKSSAEDGVTAQEIADHLGKPLRMVTVSLNRWAPTGHPRGPLNRQVTYKIVDEHRSAIEEILSQAERA